MRKWDDVQFRRIIRLILSFCLSVSLNGFWGRIIRIRKISERLLVLKLAFLPLFHNVSEDKLWTSCKKRSQILPPGVDHGRKTPGAGLLGQRFLEKIKNGGRRFTLDWLECLGWRRSFNNFIGSLRFGVIIDREDKVKIAQKCLQILL